MSLKRIFFGLILAAFSLVAAVLVVPFFIDPNDYKTQIEDLVERYTGSKLRIDGDVRIKFWPYPRLSIEKVRLANVHDASIFEMASAKSIGLGVALLPLLREEVQLRHISVAELHIELEKMTDGEFNWEPLFKRVSQRAGPDTSDSQYRFTLDKIALDDAVITYRDADWVKRIEPINAIFRNSEPGSGSYGFSAKISLQDLPLELEGRIAEAEQGQAVTLEAAGYFSAGRSSIVLDSKLMPGAENFLDSNISIAGDNLTELLSVLTEKSPAPGLAAPYKLNAHLSVSDDRLDVDNFKLSINQSRAEGMLKIGLGRAVAAEARLQVDTLDLDELIAVLKSPTTASGDKEGGHEDSTVFRFPAQLAARIELGIDTLVYKDQPIRESSLQAVLEEGVLHIERLSGRLPGDADFGLSGELSSNKSAAQFQGSLRLATEQLRTLLSWLDLGITDIPPERLQTLDIETEFEAVSKRVRLSDTVLKIDDSTVRGKAQIEMQHRPVITANLELDGLTLDDYLPKGEDIRKRTGTLSSKTVVETKALAQDRLFDALMPLTAIDADIAIRAARISYDGRDLNATSLRGIFRQSELEIRADQAPGISARLKLNLQKLAEQDTVSAAYHLSAKELQSVIKLLDPDFKPPSQQLGRIDLKGNAGGTLKRLALDTDFEFQDGSAKLKGVVTDVLDAPGYSMDYDIRVEDSSRMLSLATAKPPLSPQELGNINVRGKFSGNGSEMKLEGESVVAEALIVFKSTIGFEERLRLEINVTVSVDDPRRLMTLAGIEPTLAPGKLKAKLTAKGGIEHMEFNTALTLLSEARLLADGRVLDLGGEPRYELSFAATHPDAYRFLRSFDPKYAPFAGKRLGDIRLSGRLSAGFGEMQVSEFEGAIGTVDLRGKIDLQRRKNGYRLFADLISGQFDLRSMLPEVEGIERESGGSSVKKTAIPQKTVLPDTPLSLDALKGIEAQVKLHAEQLLLPGLATRKVSADIDVREGGITLKPLAAEIGGGRLNAELDIRPRGGNDIDVKTALKIENMELGRVLQDLEVKRLFEGRLDADIDLHGKGGSVAELAANLNGKTSIVIGKGRIGKGYIDRYIQLYAAGLFTNVRKRIWPFDESKAYNEFNCYVDRWQISSGAAKAAALLFDNERMSIVTSGGIDLKTERLDLYLTSSPKEGVSIGRQGRLSFSFGELTKPIKIGGTLAEPEIDIVLDETAFVRGAGGSLIFGPFGMIAALAKYNPDEGNVCLAAIEASGKGVQVEEEKRDIIDKTTGAIIETGKRIGNGLGRGLRR